VQFPQGACGQNLTSFPPNMMRTTLLACLFYNSLLIGSAEGDCSTGSPQSCADPTTLLQMKAQTEAVEDDNEEMPEHEDAKEEDTDDAKAEGFPSFNPSLGSPSKVSTKVPFQVPQTTPKPCDMCEGPCMGCIANIMSSNGHRRRACKQLGVNRRRSAAESCGDPSNGRRRYTKSARCYKEMENTCKESACQRSIHLPETFLPLPTELGLIRHKHPRCLDIPCGQ